MSVLFYLVFVAKQVRLTLNQLAVQMSMENGVYGRLGPTAVNHAREYVNDITYVFHPNPSVLERHVWHYQILKLIM